jgi:hypothetical protein
MRRVRQDGTAAKWTECNKRDLALRFLCSSTKAKTETALMNKKLGLNEEKVNELIISTMGPPIRQKK